MRVIIAGGRDFNDYELLENKCDFYLQNFNNRKIEIVSGTCKGADKLGEQYAESRGYPVRRLPADWDKHGKVAGHIRNVQMSEYAECLISFWDGESRGTKDMIEIATNKFGILKVKIVLYDK